MKLLPFEQVEYFFEEVWTLINDVLPTFGAEPSVIFDEEEKSAKLRIEFPLAFSTASPEEAPKFDGDLFRISIFYHMQQSREGGFLAVHRSSYAIRIGNVPLFRMEYDRDKDFRPAAHIHYANWGDGLSIALLRNKPTKKSRTGNTDSLHIPVGGRRFRPSLEEFLYFVIEECGFYAKTGWEERLLEGHRSWLDTQLVTAVRDNPSKAVEALRSLGYDINPPPSGEIPNRRYPGW